MVDFNNMTEFQSRKLGLAGMAVLAAGVIVPIFCGAYDKHFTYTTKDKGIEYTLSIDERFMRDDHVVLAGKCPDGTNLVYSDLRGEDYAIESLDVLYGNGTKDSFTDETVLNVAQKKFKSMIDKIKTEDAKKATDLINSNYQKVAQYLK